jgi:hypothetical protein
MILIHYDNDYWMNRCSKWDHFATVVVGVVIERGCVVGKWYSSSRWWGRGNLVAGWWLNWYLAWLIDTTNRTNNSNQLVKVVAIIAVVVVVVVVIVSLVGWWEDSGGLGEGREERWFVVVGGWWEGWLRIEWDGQEWVRALQRASQRAACIRWIEGSIGVREANSNRTGDEQQSHHHSQQWGLSKIDWARRIEWIVEWRVVTLKRRVETNNKIMRETMLMLIIMKTTYNLQDDHDKPRDLKSSNVIRW